MTYKTIPLALSVPVDLDRIQRTADYYANGRFFIEVYQGGTCVLPSVSKEGGAGDGLEELKRLSAKHLDFTVREMDDHNFVVGFTERVFAVVFPDEFVSLKSELSGEVSPAGVDEVLVGKAGAPKEHMLIGLFARTRLLADIEKPVLARKVVPTRQSGAAPT